MGLFDALSFRRASPPRANTILPKPQRIRSKRPLAIAGLLFLYGSTAYGTWFYLKVAAPSEALIKEDSSFLSPDTDVSGRYDDIAPEFDKEVDCCEFTSGLGGLRKRLIRQAKGHVLEVSVGTGRNAQYYDLQACKSITFVDQSGPMLQIAMKKWRELHPKPVPDTAIAFRKQSALDPLEMPKDGYDTIVQTMGVCSTPIPAETLSHLGTLLNPKTGRFLLLEHGASFYDWVNRILDSSAPHHAKQYGCRHNKDIGRVLEQSGLVVEKMNRPYWWNLGTVWVIEARPKGWDRKDD